MKKTIIALMALAGVAAADSYTWDATTTGAVLGGTATGGFTTDTYTPNQGTYADEELTVLKGSTYYELGVDTLYNWVNDALDGKSELTFSGTISIGTSTSNVTLLHIGRKDFGLTLGVNGSNLVLTNANIDSGSSITLASIPVNSSNSNKWYMHDYSVTLSKGGVVTYSLNGGETQTASSKFTTNWTDGTTPAGQTPADYAVEQNYRYSIGVEAPGWTGSSLNDNFTTTGITITSVAVPEPTTATLSLLALAGLAARRRR